MVKLSQLIGDCPSGNPNSLRMSHLITANKAWRADKAASQPDYAIESQKRCASAKKGSTTKKRNRETQAAAPGDGA